MNFLSSPLFSVLMVFAGSGTMGAIIVAWSKRGVTEATEAKTKAEAAEVISRTASERVQEVESQIKGMKMAYRQHAVWDREARQTLVEHGINIGDPPDLWFFEVI